MNIKASLLTLGALVLAPATANAIPEKEPHGSAAGLVGYSFQADGGHGLFGFGLRGGYTLRQNIYIGGMFMDHFAEDEVMYLLGVEGGYDFQLEPVVLRPYIGLGGAHDTYSLTFTRGTVEVSDTVFAFWFGGAVLFNLNEQWFIGGDFKVPIFSSGGAALLIPSLTGGLNF